MNPQDTPPQVPPQQPQYGPQPPVSPTPDFNPQPQQPVSAPVEPQPGYQAPVQPMFGAQPAPAPSPVAFNPVAAAPVSSGSNKGKLIALIGGAVGLLVLLAVGMLVLLPMFMGVSKKDYVAASEKMGDVKSAYNKMGGVYISSSSTDTEIKNNLDTLKSARQDFDAKLADLGGTTAIKRDKDLKKLYGDVMTKKPNFDKAADAGIEAYEKILPAMSSFRSVSSSGADVSTQIAAVANKLEGISGLKDENNKQYVSKMVALLKKYAVLARKVQQGRNNYNLYDSQAVDDFYNTDTAISDATRDWQSNLTKLSDDGELKDQLNALDDKLFEKTLNQK